MLRKLTALVLTASMLAAPCAPALADAIRRICVDRQTWQHYAEGARMRFERMFTANGMIDKMIDIYEK